MGTYGSEGYGKELNVIEDIVKITSSVSEENISELDALAQKLAALQP